MQTEVIIVWLKLWVQAGLNYVAYTAPILIFKYRKYEFRKKKISSQIKHFYWLINKKINKFHVIPIFWKIKVQKFF